ncbi:hypothetical protein [Candidatus Protochlamydia phocaeensis]|uniref:hypothetical protein n=1 Tax=Candidatus Protochlamydia phocaeensis TaxID=1414722 RepID=UPI0008386DA9|nr:hypothetical protein [Candidatus Protochlamydia phocaeensis]
MSSYSSQTGSSSFFPGYDSLWNPSYDFLWNDEEGGRTGLLPDTLATPPVDQIPSSAPLVQPVHQIGMQSLQPPASSNAPLFISLEGFISLTPQVSTPSLSYLNFPPHSSNGQDPSTVTDFNPFFFDFSPKLAEQPVMTIKQEECKREIEIPDEVNASNVSSSKKRKRRQSEDDRIKAQVEEQEEVLNLQEIKQRRRKEKNRISAKLSRDRKKEIGDKHLSELKEFDSMVKRINTKCAVLPQCFSSLDNLSSQPEGTHSKNITVEEIDRSSQREHIEEIVNNALSQIQIQERRALKAETELSLAHQEMARLKREIQILRKMEKYSPQTPTALPSTLAPSNEFSFL